MGYLSRPWLDACPFDTETVGVQAGVGEQPHVLAVAVVAVAGLTAGLHAGQNVFPRTRPCQLVVQRGGPERGGAVMRTREPVRISCVMTRPLSSVSSPRCAADHADTTRTHSALGSPCPRPGRRRPSLRSLSGSRSGFTGRSEGAPMRPKTKVDLYGAIVDRLTFDGNLIQTPPTPTASPSPKPPGTTPAVELRPLRPWRMERSWCLSGSCSRVTRSPPGGLRDCRPKGRTSADREAARRSTPGHAGASPSGLASVSAAA